MSKYIFIISSLLCRCYNNVLINEQNKQNAPFHAWP